MSETDGRGRGRRRALLVAVTFAVGVLAGAALFAWLGGAGGSSAHAAATPSSGLRTAVALTTAHYDPEELYKLDSPGVVDISVTEKAPKLGFGGTLPLPFGPVPDTEQAEGSGFVLDRSGDIVTAAHVVTGATKLTVTFADGKTATATLVGSDPSSDTAVIKVDVPSSELTPLAFGDSAAVRPGEGVVAIGSPFGYAESITAGIVSAVGRSIQAPDGYTIPDAIQTDAAINHGNSGGPLIDEAGDVIGVDVQIAPDLSGDNAGVGFAVPSNTVKAVADDLVAGKTVSYPYLGVSVADSASGSGARIGLVKADSPASVAGLKAGDVITAVDGTKVSGADQLTSIVGGHSPGDRLVLTVDRDGKTLTVDATLGTRPAASST